MRDETVYTGRLLYGPQPLCFDEHDFVSGLLGGCGSTNTLEAEAKSWIQTADDEEDAEKAFGGEAEWHLGFASGIAAVLCDLADCCKGIHVPRKGDIPPKPSDVQIDLLFRDRTLEIWIDVPDAQAHNRQLALPVPAAKTEEPLVPDDTHDEDQYSVANSIIDLRISGTCIADIANKLKLSRSVVLLHLRTAGLPIHDPEPATQATTQTKEPVLPSPSDCELVSDIIDMRSKHGWDIYKIARQLNTSSKIVKAALKGAGLSIDDVCLHEDSDHIKEATDLRAAHGLSGAEIAFVMDDPSIRTLLTGEGKSLPEIGPYWADKLAALQKLSSAKQLLEDIRRRVRRLREDGWDDARIIRRIQQDYPEEFHLGIRIAVTRPAVLGNWKAA